MRICFALLYLDTDHAGDDPTARLSRVRVAHDLPRALVERGHDVDVVHLHGLDGTYDRDGVHHHFVAPGATARVCAALLAPRSIPSRAVLTPAWRAITRVHGVRPDIVHFFGTSLHLNLSLLAATLADDGPALVIHHHGGDPARSALSRRLQRFGFRRGDRVLFTTREQADRFIAGKLVDGANTQWVQMVEGSSTFRRRPREEARRATGMRGSPVCLSSARLAPPKDPMAVLRGFERLVPPGAHDVTDPQLYLHYRTDEMLPELESWVADRPQLRDRVHFRGARPYEAMEAVYNSADFLLQASHREHSGFAVLDAMACGVIPVVSDIPSFRVITDNGRVGGLFSADDAAALAGYVRGVCRGGIAAASAAVTARFEQALSYQALARQLEDEYAPLVHVRDKTGMRSA